MIFSTLVNVHVWGLHGFLKYIMLSWDMIWLINQGSGLGYSQCRTWKKLHDDDRSTPSLPRGFLFFFSQDRLTWSHLKGLPTLIGVSHSPLLEIKSSSSLIQLLRPRPTHHDIIRFGSHGCIRTSWVKAHPVLLSTLNIKDLMRYGAARLLKRIVLS